MYTAHPVFVQPENEEVRVWRYMDFTKFVSLIDSRRLYFTRADKFDDPFEGSWPKMNIIARQNIPPEIPAEAHENFRRAMKGMSEWNKNLPRFTAINCWHMNDHESAAMWKLYLKSEEGIAIQSTYRKLRDAITAEDDVYLGVVKYIDYESEWVDAKNLFSPFVHKRKSFEHEREVRAVISKWPTGETGFDFTQETIEHGINLRVDLERLIDNIYVAPSAPNWLSGLVTAVVQRYGYSFSVVHSRLNEQPMF
ncbi:hypothetical protein JNX00_07295 [Hydrogenophaga sp. YM1]|uniref:hypothetical protein n=1 Tax=Hydrogenophaga sp. YM1 TaxID=2806262 RepID=UPI00195723B4|nr:hypothetical protein [Hydrogenophaga sp. YM1]QRR35658.1 hypothetical protein JNX00_07295 [Hydrogenophaga sp. YM1]